MVELIESRWYQAYDRHEEYAAVQAPETPFEKRIGPCVFLEYVPDREKHERDRQETIHAEQRGMGVYRGRIDPLDIIKDNGRIYEKSEYTGADEVPEGNRNEEIERPSVLIGRTGFINSLEIHRRFKSKQRERNDLKGGENPSEGHDRSRRTRPVEVMECSYYAASEIEEHAQVYGGVGEFLA